MEIKNVDQALESIIKQRNALEKLDYNDENYDVCEEELHDLEDDFQDQYGKYMESILQKVHDEYCPENDVLLPIAYLGDGVLVEMEKFPRMETRLVLKANPLQILLKVGQREEKVVWTAS